MSFYQFYHQPGQHRNQPGLLCRAMLCFHQVIWGVSRCLSVHYKVGLISPSGLLAGKLLKLYKSHAWEASRHGGGSFHVSVLLRELRDGPVITQWWGNIRTKSRTQTAQPFVSKWKVRTGLQLSLFTPRTPVDRLSYLVWGLAAKIGIIITQLSTVQAILLSWSDLQIWYCTVIYVALRLRVIVSAPQPSTPGCKADVSWNPSHQFSLIWRK